MLQGTRAHFDDYDYDDYDESRYHVYHALSDEDVEDEDYIEEDTEASAEPEEVAEGGSSPTAGPELDSWRAMCNNKNCWITVDWFPPYPRETWMSCLLGYRVGFRKPGNDWTWINDKGTHRDQRSNKLFFFDEAEGTSHSLTIPNLDFSTVYEVNIEVFNPYGRNWMYRYMDGEGYSVYTPSGSLFSDQYISYIFYYKYPDPPCREVSVSEPDKFIESSENSLTVHLDGWQDFNCPTSYFSVEQRWEILI